MSQCELSGEREEVEMEPEPNDVDKVLGCPDWQQHNKLVI